MPSTAIESITPAIERAKQQLFQPFRARHWVRLALLGLATGEISNGGNFNFNVPFRQTSQSQHLLASPIAWHDPRVQAAIAALALCGVALLLIIIYVSSVCRFILFETVLSGRAELRAGWKRWQTQGRRFFGFQLLLMLAAMLVIGGPIVWIAWTATHGGFHGMREHLATAALSIAGAVMVFLALIFALALVTVLTKDFVVPQMALENTTVADGWRRLFALMQAEPKRWAGYVGMKIVLAIAAGIMLAIVWIGFFLLLLIPGILIGIIVALLIHGLGLIWTAVTIALAIIFGTLAVAGLIFGIGFVASPVTVFFPTYAYTFFADRYPPLAAQMFPPPPAPPQTPPEVAPVPAM